MMGGRVLKMTIGLLPRPVQRTVAQLIWPRKHGVCSACRRPRAMPFAVNKPDTRAGRDHDAWKQEVMNAIRQHPEVKSAPMNGPLRVRLVFVMPRPKTRPQVPKTITKNKKKIPNPRHGAGDFVVSAEDWATGQRVPCPRIPDVDRLTNSLHDCLTQAGAWWDDGQVASLRADKWYAAVGEEPSITLTIEQL